MATAKDIRRRIRTVKNIEKITSAMKMVAAARLKKAQSLAEAARPYADKMREIMTNLSHGAGEIRHPLLEARPEVNAAFIIIGAERGLAGSYNANVLNKAMHAIGDRNIENVKLILVGKKAAAFFKRKPYPVVANVTIHGSEISFADIRPVTAQARALFESGEVDAVYLVYARFITTMRQEPTVVKLLPVAAPDAGAQPAADFEFEPNPGELLGRLLPRYVDTTCYQALVESQASEQGARMAAMSAATKNAGEMIDTLTLAYNKARQAAITKEITEIVGGAEALR